MVTQWTQTQSHMTSSHVLTIHQVWSQHEWLNTNELPETTFLYLVTVLLAIAGTDLNAIPSDLSTCSYFKHQFRI